MLSSDSSDARKAEGGNYGGWLYERGGRRTCNYVFLDASVSVTFIINYYLQLSFSLIFPNPPFTLHTQWIPLLTMISARTFINQKKIGNSFFSVKLWVLSHLGHFWVSIGATEPAFMPIQTFLYSKLKLRIIISFKCKKRRWSWMIQGWASEKFCLL